MGNAGELARDLTDRAPGHGLIEKLLDEWDAGRIRVDADGAVVIDDEAKSWYWGVLGERRTATVLTESAFAHNVLHSVPVGSGGADLDHVVVTPSGVFTINTKYSPGSTIWTAGHGLIVNSTSRAAYLRSAVREARRTEQSLSAAAGFAVPVHPFLVFIDPGSLTRKAPNEVDGTLIRVCTDTELLYVMDIRRELSDDQVARVADVARDPWTWLKAAKPSRPGQQLARKFDALREAVGVELDITRSPSPIGVPRRTVRTGSSQPRSRATGASWSGDQRFAIGCLGLLVFPVLGVVGWELLNAAVQAFFAR